MWHVSCPTSTSTGPWLSLLNDWLHQIPIVSFETKPFGLGDENHKGWFLLSVFSSIFGFWLYLLWKVKSEKLFSFPSISLPWLILMVICWAFSVNHNFSGFPFLNVSLNPLRKPNHFWDLFFTSGLISALTNGEILNLSALKEVKFSF